jgi:hypothetical protein
MPWGKNCKESGEQEEYGTQELRKIEKCNLEGLRNRSVNLLKINNGD